MGKFVYTLRNLCTGEIVAGRNLRHIVRALNSGAEPRLRLHYAGVHRAMSSGANRNKGGAHKMWTARRLDPSEWRRDASTRWIE